MIPSSPGDEFEDLFISVRFTIPGVIGERSNGDMCLGSGDGITSFTQLGRPE